MIKNIRYSAVIALVAVVVGGGVWHLNKHASDDANQATDDAYVDADLTVISPRVSGVVEQVFVSDYTPVKAGEPLVNIDERDLAIAHKEAQADMMTAKAAVTTLDAQLARQASLIKQAEATLQLDKAKLSLAQTNQKRFKNLARDGAGTVLAKQQADADLKTQQAIQARDEAMLASAKQEVGILMAQLQQAKAKFESAQAKLNGAILQQSYAKLTAPISGLVAQVKARKGGHVNVGQPLLTIVPIDKVYIEAQYLETQLANVEEGQPVTVKVDALPGVTLRGTVAHLAPASLVSYSPIAPHNATGNFTKITQRLPVRIHLTPGQEALSKLRVGMSVRPVIHTDQ
ncbi:HlyD family secretion protein [Marinomonas pollencensis]|uniref:Membrane fusion protein (Multidrug efflux system) n=1 Tax=Marinomonas pollencensis TaxID=491954 RepID=A0A3E0DLX0_9GAMM|nr:HlyD family secretion protein [Marinomonas pollencensis]REG83657.1 membrane fusion protein (multidrug efflux system) [Marinomonas pollencensis]